LVPPFLAAEVGIRAVLLKRRLDEAVRLMLASSKEERSLTDIARCCPWRQEPVQPGVPRALRHAAAAPIATSPSRHAQSDQD